MSILNKIYRLFFPAKFPEEIKRAYGIPDQIEFQFELRPNGWMVLTSNKLPGFITEGRNPQELLEMFNDAILTYYDVPKKDADVVFPAIHLSGIGSVSYKKTEIHCNA